MKCPTCAENTPDAWKQLWVLDEEWGGKTHGLPSGEHRFRSLTFDWMHCANPKCAQLVIRIHETVHLPGQEAETASWLAYPRTSHRPIDPLVPERYRRDYQEAASILDLSPSMSAVLSRRILGDLLKEYAEKEHFSLAARIDSFVGDGVHPSKLTDNLHHFREIADFGAHTQEDKGQSADLVIIDVDRDEAEWTLDLVDRLFDYFIVTPAKDEAVKRKMDEKIKKAGRKPLREPGKGKS